MSDDAAPGGFTPPSMESRAADAPPMPYLPPAVRLPATPPPAVAPNVAAPPSAAPKPTVPMPPLATAPPNPSAPRPPAASQSTQAPAMIAASRPSVAKQRPRPVTVFVVVVTIAGLAAAGLLGYRMMSGTSDEATAIAANPSTGATLDGASTLPSTATPAPIPAGWVTIAEQSVGFSLPTSTERTSAWMLGPNGQVEGSNSAQYAITPGGGAISVAWDNGDPAGREQEIVAQVAQVPGGVGTPTISNWTPIPSRVGSAVGADYAYEGQGLTLGSGRLLVLMTPSAVVVVKYLSTDDPKVIESVFKSITIDGKPAF